MDIQRLRNLTTGRLHTEIGHVYEDLEHLIGEQGVMTHMIPRVMESVRPWLVDHIKDLRFWNGKHDTTHTGQIELPDPSTSDREAMLERFKAMPNPLAGKDVLVVSV